MLACSETASLCDFLLRWEKDISNKNAAGVTNGIIGE